MGNTSISVNNKEILQQMADFIAKTELEHSRSSATQDIFSIQLSAKKRELDQKLHELSTEVKQLRTLLSRSGINEWRQESEQLAQKGQQELRALEETIKDIKSHVVRGSEQLNRSTMNTVKTVAKLVTSFRGNDLKRITERNSVDLHHVAEENLQYVDKALHRFHWRNLGMALVVALVVSFVMSVYIDNALPWQMHREVAKEREAGQALVSAWPKLSHAAQATIIEDA